MRAIEIDVTIDNNGRVQMQLPNDVAPQQARALLLLDEAPAPAAAGETRSTFRAIALNTEGYRFRRDDSKNDD